MANWNRQTWAHGIVNAWERMPYIYGAKERVLSLTASSTVPPFCAVYSTLAAAVSEARYK